ncbi:MAG: NTP transferase domain-containing protein [Cyclobacteriaceae bacterium]|nr:NTP transferase domain-containing protein [Cyclobacteriaceae bacterium]
MINTTPYGLILTGGQSTRMGTNKSLLNYNGTPQREYLFKLLSKCCSGVFTSCREDQEVPQSLNPLTDYYNFPGPINGILSAFQAHPKESWLILAVDMPFVDEKALQFLLSHRDKRKLATCFMHSPAKFPEPLLTLWEPAAHAPLLAFAQAGNMSARAFLAQANIQTIEPYDKKILLNINYPEDMDSLL